MSALLDLLPEENALVVGLPYRVGLWVSHADDEKGDHDDLKERAALERVITTVAKMRGSTGFAQQVAQETIRQKTYWPHWAKQSDQITGDCTKALAILNNYVTAEDVVSYKRLLLRIAETVALAHGEFGKIEYANENLVAGFFEKIAEKFGAVDDDQPLENISASEQCAINELKQALQ